MDKKELAWREQAACKGMDPNIFFPVRGQDSRPAKKVCSTCPVKSECFEYGYLYGDKNGIWGGVAERQMRIIRRNRVAEALKAS